MPNSQNDLPPESSPEVMVSANTWVEQASGVTRFLSNAGANVLSGAVTAVYQLAVAGLAARTWHGATFSAWALALSVAAIAPVFAVNLSSVITRRLVEARHTAPEGDDSAVVRSGLSISAQLTAAAFVVVTCVGITAYEQATQYPISLFGFLLLLVTLLATNCWLILWQVKFGRYYAMERNWPPALTSAAARLGGAAGMWGGLAINPASLGTAALGLCVGTWAGLLLAQLMLSRPDGLRNAAAPSAASLSREYRNSLRLLTGFAVGGLSLLVVQYSVTPIMAIIAAERFNAFYLANAITLVAVGALAAGMSALLAPLTKWRAGGEYQSLRRAALFSPIAMTTTCISVLCVCWFALEPLLDIAQIRASSISEIRPYLAILGLQAIVRTAAGGYAMYVASVGTARQMAIPLVIEIVLACAIAIPLGLAHGDQAMLFGLIVASLIGSLYSSRVVASLCEDTRISLRHSFPSLLFAQIATGGVWWIITSATS